jgi:hypothetical protein
VEDCVGVTRAVEPARVTIESAQFAAPRLTCVLFRFNRCRLNKAPVEVSRREFLSVRLSQHVPYTLVGQPLSLLEGCDSRLTGAGNRSLLAVASDDKEIVGLSTPTRTPAVNLRPCYIKGSQVRTAASMELVRRQPSSRSRASYQQRGSSPETCSSIYLLPHQESFRASLELTTTLVLVRPL